MKFHKLLGLIVCMGVLLSSCPEPLPPGPMPDLTITTFETTGPATARTTSGHVEVPVRVVVKNQGGAAAGVFKVSTDYQDSTGRTYMCPFSVPGQEDTWCPHTDAPLAAGSEVTFEGKVVFTLTRGETVSLWAIADSCADEEHFTEPLVTHCRVVESNEDNNDSAPISVQLP